MALLDLADALRLLLLDLDTRNPFAAADAICHVLFPLGYELALLCGLAREAPLRDRRGKRDVALRLAQLGVFRVLDVGLPAESLSWRRL